MTIHFNKEVDALKRMILNLSGRVEAQLQRAVDSIQKRDVALATQVLDGDRDIDHAEVDVEEECLKILALHQPVAHDLRFIIAVLKINNDLERIGDLAVNIAERAIFLANQALPGTDFDFSSMAEKASTMVRESLDALLQQDVNLAVHVRESDDAVDEINRDMYEHIKTSIRKNPEHLDALIHLLSVSRHLERVGDHATNIAEDVIYMLKGEIVRHRFEDYTND
jgi:phosphate transport system protein